MAERIIQCAGDSNNCGERWELRRADLPGSCDFHIWLCPSHMHEFEFEGAIDGQGPEIEITGGLWLRWEDCPHCSLQLMVMSVWERVERMGEGVDKVERRTARCVKCDA